MAGLVPSSWPSASWGLSQRDCVSSPCLAGPLTGSPFWVASILAEVNRSFWGCEALRKL